MQTNTVVLKFTIFSTALLLAATADAQYKAVNLVADQPGLAKYQDSNIGDAWDIAELPNGGFAVANAWTGLLTFYSRDGRTMRSPVTVPAAAILGPGAVGSPAGLALNRTYYVISKNGKSAPSLPIWWSSAAQLSQSSSASTLCWSPQSDWETRSSAR